MSSYRIRKTAVKVDLPAVGSAPETGDTIQVATYVAEMLKGLRRTYEGRKDLAFLDYLLAMAEEESMCLAANIYH